MAQVLLINHSNVTLKLLDKLLVNNKPKKKPGLKNIKFLQLLQINKLKIKSLQITELEKVFIKITGIIETHGQN
jgi:hypothetical protein